MATRARLIKRDENEISGKLADKLPVKLDGTKRGALGDIGNKFLVPQINDKDKRVSTVFKDVKPRVDTRWKKAANPVKQTVVTRSVKEATRVVTKTVVTRQTSKPEIVQIKKDKDTILEKTAGVLNPVLHFKSLKVPSLLRSEKLTPSKGAAPKTTEVKTKTENDTKSHSQKLICQVDNIDHNDQANPQLLSEYVNDIYAYLFKLEDIFPIRENFLSAQIDVTPKMRSVLLDWINEVHCQFMLENETYHMAVSMIDRYLQAVSQTPRKQLQLVGISALFMASKYEELLPPDIADFVYVTDDTYTKAQVLDMEKRIFKALDFHLGKPLPIHFLRRFAKAAGHVGDRQYMLAKYLIELASVDYGMAHYKPSEIAASSLLLALYVFNRSNDENEISCTNNLWTDTLEFYSKYNQKQLMPIVKKLAKLVKSAGEAKLKAVYTKYSNNQFKFTSKLPELTGTKMDTIINS